MPDPAAERERKERWTPDRETLELATAGAAKVLGHDHGVTRALARAAITGVARERPSHDKLHFL